MALILPNFIKAQENTIDREKYPFIQFSKNEITSCQPGLMNTFYNSLSKLMKEGNNQINIIQIGDSHIQADIFSNTLRNLLQDFIPGGGATSRGFIFPYNIAKSNNPWNYKINYSGTWQNCKNLNPYCECGLAGAQIKTYDKSNFISIAQSQDNIEKINFNKLRVYISNPDTTYSIYVNTIPVSAAYLTSENSEYIEFTFSKPVQACNIFFNRKKNNNQPISLFGISLLSDEPGITYHALGVNGTTIKAYSNCKRIFKEIQNLYPDLIILSLGTNDAYVPYLNTYEFRNTYSDFVQNLKNIFPGIPIILTTPGDCLYKRKFSNNNIVLAGNIIKDIACEKEISYWDYYSIMGGQNSIRYWMRQGLATYDGIHYQKAGYQLQANLFMESLLTNYYKYLRTKE